ncbi:MAG: hypothetical protein JNK16_07005 [Phycisphaerales bacterium]|nr:hypothetical protein [Phycisphaerales bacterium]
MAKNRSNYPPSHPPSNRAAPEIARTLVLAKQVTDATGCPVVGGIAVALHGWPRYTGDIDIYSANFWETHIKLEDAGFHYDAKHREHIIDGVAIHMVADDSLGGPPKRVSTIKGVKVIGLPDLIRGKLTVGLNEPKHGKDVLDVLELIRIIPLKKDFASKLPKELRAAFKELVDQIHGKRHSAVPPLKFWKKYA